jgi:NADH dehydrogenase FAD-containing subunit
MYLSSRKKAKEVPMHVVAAKNNLYFSTLSFLSFIAAGFIGSYQYFCNRSRAEMDLAKRGPKIVVIGASCAGSTAAAALTQHFPDSPVTVLDKSRDQVFNALQPLAAAGHRSYDLVTQGPNTLYAGTCWTVNRDAKLILQGAVAIDAARQHVVDAQGVRHEYDYLVLAMGAIKDYSSVPGLHEDASGLDLNRIAVTSGGMRDGLCSSQTGNIFMVRVPAKNVYCRSHEGNFASTVNTTWKFLDFFRKLSPVTVAYGAMTPDARPSDKLPAAHNAAILEHWDERGVKFWPRMSLVSVDAKRHEATFRDDGAAEAAAAVAAADPTQQKQSAKQKAAAAAAALVTLPYRLLMLDLPLKAPPVVAASGLSDAGLSGFANVDPQTLQHREHANIFAVGDCAALPNPKSYGAIFAQVPVMVHNMTQVMKGMAPNALYDGYSSFHITMSTWKTMWPEMKDAGHNHNHAGQVIDAGQEVVRAKGHIWNDAKWWGPRGVAQGVYMQTGFYEMMYWFVFLRAWWYPPRWFTWPAFPDSVEPLPAAPGGQQFVLSS